MNDNDDPAKRDVTRGPHLESCHAFVEPAPATQPPADAVPKRILIIDDDTGASRSMLRRLASRRGEYAPVFVATADPHVTGDGDEAVSHQYLQGPWGDDKCAEDNSDGSICFRVRAAHRFEPQTSRETEAYAAGLARGRALGARDEREEIVKMGGYRECTATKCEHSECAMLRLFKRAIIDRRARRG